MKVRSLLPAFVDDELEGKNRDDLLEHIQVCQACQQELDELLADHRLFQSVERFQTPYAFSAGVMARIRDGELSWFEVLFTRQPFFFKFVELVLVLLIMMIGAFSGNVLITSRSDVRHAAAVQEILPLYAFDTTPAGSIGNTYVELTGVDNER